MIEFVTSPENLPFAVALTIMVLIAAIEGVGALLGFALSGLLDNLVPELEIDIDTGDVVDPGAFGEFLSWLRFREVPVIVLLIAFLTSFGLTGLVMQQALFSSFGFMLPSLVAAVLAFFAAMPGVRFFGGVIGRIMPKDETEAVNADSFIGRPAVLTLGSATNGSSAQARLNDKFGQTHYVMIEPEDDGVVFNQGDALLIVRRDGGTFYAVPDDRPELKDL